LSSFSSFSFTFSFTHFFNPTDIAAGRTNSGLLRLIVLLTQVNHVFNTLFFLSTVIEDRRM
jgi:hypothetical protein